MSLSQDVRQANGGNVDHLADQEALFLKLYSSALLCSLVIAGMDAFDTLLTIADMEVREQGLDT